MFVAIYQIYFNSLFFIRRNLLVILPYFLYDVLLLFQERFSVTGASIKSFIYFIILTLILCLTETLSIALVYLREGVIISSTSIWRIFTRFYDQAIFLVFTVFLIIVIWDLILHFLNISLNELISLFLSLLLFYGFFALGLRHKMFNNSYVDIRSGAAGLKELYKNFLFYFFIAIFGIILLVLPSLFLRNARIHFSYISAGLYGLELLLTPMLYALTSISLTYAFIFKNKKDKHAS